MKEPPKAAALFPTLTPPKGESGQNRSVGPIAQSDPLEGESIGGADWRGGTLVFVTAPPANRSP